MEEVQFDTTGQKNLDWTAPGHPVQSVPDVEIFLINQPKMQPLGGGDLRLSRSRPRLATRSSMPTGAAPAKGTVYAELSWPL